MDKIKCPKCAQEVKAEEILPGATYDSVINADDITRSEVDNYTKSLNDNPRSDGD